MLKKLKNVNLFLVIMITAFVFGISLKIVLADYLFNSQPKGISVGNAGISLGNGENLFWGVIKSDSTGNFVLLQDSNYSDKFKIGYNGNLLSSGNIEASGNMKAAGQNVCLQNGTNCPAAGIPSDLVAGSSVVSDAEVDNNITLDNITQITNRSHSNLQNLTADDHTQYLRADGARAMSGALTANGGINLQNNGDTDYKIEGRRSIGEYPGWDANRLYINGYNDWSSGVTVAGAGLNVDGAIKQGGTAVSLSGHAHSAGDITSGTLLTGRGGTGLSATGASGNLLRSNGSTWDSWAPNYLTAEVDGSVTNEIQTLGTSGDTITLSLGGGSVTSPYASKADTVDSQHYDANWPTTLANMKTAASNDFHNLGGTDNVGVTAHNALSGLGNDDHSQYLRADGARAMSGALQMSASGENNITAINALVGYNDLYVKGSSAEDKPIYYGASEHKFYTEGTTKLTILNNGNVGIGTTVPVFKLQLEGTADDTNLAFRRNDSNIPSGKITSFGITSNGLLTYGSSLRMYKGEFEFWTNKYPTDGSYNYSKETVHITNDGYVGIGTTEPTEALEVNGNIKASGAIAASGAIHTDSHITASGSVYMGYKKEIKDCGAASSCQVDCETGKVVLGGGCSSYNNDSYLYQSIPTNTNTGWFCAHSGSGKALAVYAICARIAN